ncbi:MAG: tRNA (cytidine(34)-2'-O)-methyltransferase [Christensenellales bacterium]|jgi:tRNA (cytidine/uridine-2'-O-)-methyltransferase
MENHIVLLEPEIPQNAGNISRTCAVTGTHLHFVGKLGFSLSDRYLKRAGLDYWPFLKHSSWDTLDELLEAYADMPTFYTSTKAPRDYCQAYYGGGPCMFIFGKETAGLPEALLKAHWRQAVRIPMIEGTRSLNLSNSVAIVLYEALRQQGFPGLQSVGAGLGDI